MHYVIALRCNDIQYINTFVIRECVSGNINREVSGTVPHIGPQSGLDGMRLMGRFDVSVVFAVFNGSSFTELLNKFIRKEWVITL